MDQMLLDGNIIFLRLTPRLRRIGALLVSGCSTNIEIAERMNTTPGVIGNLMMLILNECGVTNRVDLALFIVRTPGLEALLLDFEASFVPRQKKPYCPPKARGRSEDASGEVGINVSRQYLPDLFDLGIQ